MDQVLINVLEICNRKLITYRRKDFRSAPLRRTSCDLCWAWAAWG